MKSEHPGTFPKKENQKTQSKVSPYQKKYILPLVPHWVRSAKSSSNISFDHIIIIQRFQRLRQLVAFRPCDTHRKKLLFIFHLFRIWSTYFFSGCSVFIILRTIQKQCVLTLLTATADFAAAKGPAPNLALSREWRPILYFVYYLHFLCGRSRRHYIFCALRRTVILRAGIYWKLSGDSIAITSTGSAVALKSACRRLRRIKLQELRSLLLRDHMLILWWWLCGGLGWCFNLGVPLRALLHSIRHKIRIPTTCPATSLIRSLNQISLERTGVICLIISFHFSAALLTAHRAVHNHHHHLLLLR